MSTEGLMREQDAGEVKGRKGVAEGQEGGARSATTGEYGPIRSLRPPTPRPGVTVCGVTVGCGRSPLEGVQLWDAETGTRICDEMS